MKTRTKKEEYKKEKKREKRTREREVKEKTHKTKITTKYKTKPNDIYPDRKGIVNQTRENKSSKTLVIFTVLC